FQLKLCPTTTHQNLHSFRYLNRFSRLFKGFLANLLPHYSNPIFFYPALLPVASKNVKKLIHTLLTIRARKLRLRSTPRLENLRSQTPDNPDSTVWLQKRLARFMPLWPFS